MAKTGIKVQQECIESFNKIKQTKGGKSKTLDFLVLKIEKNQVVVDMAPEFGSSAKMDEYSGEDKVPASYRRLKDVLIKCPGAYAFYDFEWEEVDGRQQSELKFISWSNDEKGNPNSKMLYSGTKAEVIKSLNPGKEIQANDADDLGYIGLIQQMSKGKAKK